MSLESTHIVHLLHYFGTGGLENGLVNLINRLPHQQFKHTIICINGFDAGFTQRLNGSSVEIISLNKPAGRDFTYLLRLRKHLKSLQPDIVHSRGLAALEAQLAGILLPVTRIHGEHGWDSAAAKNNKKHQWLRKLLSPLIAKFVVLSQEGFEFLTDDIGIAKQRINLICNGVDTDKFVSQQTEQIEQTNVVITHVGRLVEVKNQKLLINAFDVLINRHGLAHIQLRIVGEGEYRAALSAQIKQLNLETHCLLLGNCDDVQQQLAGSHIFVLPSYAEGISNTILESMACGLPVIASAVGGNTELVDHQHSGVLFDSDDLNQLVAALTQYINDEVLRLQHGKNARERVLENFSLNKMVTRYQQLYLRINT